MQVLVKDVESFDSSIHIIQHTVVEIEDNCRINRELLSGKEEKCRSELSTSDILLQAAITEETLRNIEYAEALANNAQADIELAMALSTGNPIAIAGATAYAAETFHELQEALLRKEEATTHRYNMETRVELANSTLHKITIFLDEVQLNFKQRMNNISHCSEYGIARMHKAKNILESYNSYSNALNSVHNKNLTQKEFNKKYLEKVRAHKETYINNQYAGTVYNNVKFSEYGFPMFGCDFETNIASLYFNESRGVHFRLANESLKANIQHDIKIRDSFSNRQLKQIELGVTPDGYTWHHDGNPPPGNLQLVKTVIHNGIGHTGGYKTWASSR